MKNPMPPLTPYSSSVLADLKTTLVDRGGSYADISDNARIHLALMESLGYHTQGDHAAPETITHCAHMMATKLSRLFSGDPTHEDSWLDIAGYAILVTAHLRRAKMTEADGSTPATPPGYGNKFPGLDGPR